MRGDKFRCSFIAWSTVAFKRPTIVLFGRPFSLFIALAAWRALFTHCMNACWNLFRTQFYFDWHSVIDSNETYSAIEKKRWEKFCWWQKAINKILTWKMSESDKIRIRIRSKSTADWTSVLIIQSKWRTKMANRIDFTICYSSHMTIRTWFLPRNRIQFHCTSSNFSRTNFCPFRAHSDKNEFRKFRHSTNNENGMDQMASSEANTFHFRLANISICTKRQKIISNHFKVDANWLESMKRNAKMNWKRRSIERWTRIFISPQTIKSVNKFFDYTTLSWTIQFVFAVRSFHSVRAAFVFNLLLLPVVFIFHYFHFVDHWLFVLSSIESIVCRWQFIAISIQNWTLFDCLEMNALDRFRFAFMFANSKSDWNLFCIFIQFLFSFHFILFFFDCCLPIDGAMNFVIERQKVSQSSPSLPSLDHCRFQRYFCLSLRCDKRFVANFRLFFCFWFDRNLSIDDVSVSLRLLWNCRLSIVSDA